MHSLKSRETYCNHSDHLGSSIRMTDENGYVIQSITYKPFGSTCYSVGGNEPSYQYTGQELDHSGLYYYNARYYDPELGRFIQPDTVLDGLNRYTYCGNNPVKYVDPTGHESKEYEINGQVFTEEELQEYLEEEMWFWGEEGFDGDYEEYTLYIELFGVTDNLNDNLESYHKMESSPGIVEAIKGDISMTEETAMCLMMQRCDVPVEYDQYIQNVIAAASRGTIVSIRESQLYFPKNFKYADGSLIPTNGEVCAAGIIKAAASAITRRMLAKSAMSLADDAAGAYKPGQYLAGKAPKQVTPGTTTLTGQYVDDLGRVQPWKAHYDEFGRLIGRTDFNAGNAAAGIPSTHYHVYDHSSGTIHEIIKHAEGVFTP